MDYREGGKSDYFGWEMYHVVWLRASVAGLDLGRAGLGQVGEAVLPVLGLLKRTGCGGKRLGTERGLESTHKTLNLMTINIKDELLYP